MADCLSFFTIHVTHFELAEVDFSLAKVDILIELENRDSSCMLAIIGIVLSSESSSSMTLCENAVKKYLVNEYFTEADYPTALVLTHLVFLCTDFDPDKRPSMKDVIDALNAVGMRGVKRKRDEYDAEQ
ncbi:hypothetical protein H5410_035028 [Solanum commersonii]|uniref:Uncharacterized protein n=1 Tax=Solanum commersonii TaxID=4109 RepID=A0A9J5Y3E5_SOLCO|nr:hypothetical protein H5410_035028 [Solanum commersonii]